MVIVFECNTLNFDDRSLPLKQIDTVISKNYGNKANFKIFVSSEGAWDLKAIANSLNATHVFDKYHVIQWTKHTFKTQQLKQVNWLLNNSSTLDASIVDLEKSIQELVLTGKVDKAIYDLVKLGKKLSIYIALN